MAISVRVRFEVFKRDEFTCQYCGRRSPDVVLEVDHIHPVADGGVDDPMNLVTSCWECNRGKGAVALGQVMTGEDPHDRAIQILERERQLAEYNQVLAEERDRREDAVWELAAYWNTECGVREDQRDTLPRGDYHWLLTALQWCPKEKVREFMDLALNRRMTRNLRYVAACARNWRYERTAARDAAGRDDYGE